MAVAALLPLALAAGANAYLQHRVEDRITTAAAARLNPAGKITATTDNPLAGLTALFGNLGSLTITADAVQRQGLSLDLQAHLADVTTTGHTAGGTADVTVPYIQLAQRLAATGAGALQPGTDGQGLTFTTTAGSLGIPVTVHTRLTTTPHQLTVTPIDITVLGHDIPAQDLATLPGASAMSGKLAPHTIPVNRLPPHTTLAGATATDRGLVLHLLLSATTMSTAGA